MISIGNANVYLQWHITAKCDQHCKQCYMYDSPTYRDELEHPLSTAECFTILDQLCDWVRRWRVHGTVAFTGGDPLLRSDFFDLVEYARRRNIQVQVLGNPYHVDTSIAHHLCRLGIMCYQISLDGMEASHDFLRRPGSFANSVKALEILREARVNTAVSFTVSKLNRSELIEVINLAALLHIDQFDFARLVPIGSGEKMKQEMLSPLEYKELLSRVLEEYRRLAQAGARTYFGRKDHLWNLLYYERGLFFPSPKGNLIHQGCHIGTPTLTLLADGTVMACRRLPIPIGKLPENNLASILVHSPMLGNLREVHRFTKCRHCPLLNYCRGCPAIAYSTCGDYYAPDPQCWWQES